MRILLLTFVVLSSTMAIIAQPTVYADGPDLVTGTWNVNGTVQNVTTDSPYQGTNHYKFNYSFTQWWAGFGLNLNNWSNTGGRNFSGYQNIKIAFRGMTSGMQLKVRLKTGTVESQDVLVGANTSSYQVVTIPLSTFSNVNLTAITELVFSLSNVQSASGTVYVDDIKLTASIPYLGQNANHTSINTWRRAAAMGKGVNCSNWLEAYWLLPNNYPEVNKYNRALVQNLVNAGMKHFRLPVTFERLASNTPPYTIPTNQTMWRLVDSMVLWAQQMDFTLIICNHHGYDVTDANFNSELPRKTAIWQQIMTRYQNLNPERYFFELFNEPTNNINNTNLKTFFNGLIPVIRSYNTNHSLILGGNFWNSAEGLFTSQTYSDPNIIYTFHDYEPYEFTHQGMSWTTPPYLAARVFPLAGSGDSLALVNNINQVATWADTSGVPVMMGEFGCATSATTSSRCSWINTISNACRAKGIGWYYWDAISLSDAFGFYNTSNNTMIPCFSSAMRLGSSNVCTLNVTSDANQGPGSLREAVNCASNGDIITFATALANDTIKLVNTPLIMSKNITLNNATGSPLYITSQWPNPIIYTGTSATTKLENITLLGKDESIIDNRGILTLKASTIKLKSGSQMKQSNGNILFEGNNILRY